jgi:hypothetical protein
MLTKDQKLQIIQKAIGLIGPCFNANVSTAYSCHALSWALFYSEAGRLPFWIDGAYTDRDEAYLDAMDNAEISNLLYEYEAFSGKETGYLPNWWNSHCSHPAVQDLRRANLLAFHDHLKG